MSNMRRRISRRDVGRNRKRSAQRKRVKSRSLFSEQLENRLLLAGDAMFPWHNMFVATDVSGDFMTTPRDALLIINELNANGISALDPDATFGGDGEHKVFPDTMPDHLITPLDALRVINSLNSPEGEGASKRLTFQLEATDTSGNALPMKNGMPQVVVSEDFQLTMTVQDLRPVKDGVLVDGEFATGVFSAFADIEYDASSLFELIVTPPETIQDVYAPSEWYNVLPEAHLAEEDVDGDGQANEFDEIGAYLAWKYVWGPDFGGIGGPDLDGDDIPDPKATFPVGSLDLKAIDTGVLTFQTNHHEMTEHAVHFLYTPEGAPQEPEQLIDYGMTAVDIVDWVNAIDDTFPVAPDQILEDSSVTLDVLANDFLAEASTGTLALASLTQPTNGTVSISGGQVLYTPNANFFGVDTFTYTADDGLGREGIGTVTVTVTNVNDAPMANDDEYDIDEDSGTHNLDVLTNDTAGPAGLEDEAISLISVSVAPTHGTAVVSGDQIAYTPNDNFFGTDNFTYTIEDADGLTDTAIVTIQVANVNDPPVANPDEYDISEDSGTHDFAVLVNDTPGPSDFETEAITLDTITAAPANGTATINGDVVQYTPNANFFGTDTFTYTISDAGGLTDTATVTVDVTNINDAPIAADDVLFVDEFTTDNNLDVLANDLAGPGGESEVITIVGVTTPDAGGTVTIAADGQSLTYTPETDKLGPFTETFEYTVEDVDGLVDTALVTINVEPVIRPRARDDDYSAVEDSALTDNVFDVIDNDLFNDGATILPIVIGGSLLQPAHGTIEVFGDFSVRYLPDADFYGTDTFEYQIDDDFVDGGVASAPDIGLVTVTVANVNDAPIAGDDDFPGIQEDSGANTLNVLANDVPGPANEAEAPVNDSVAVLAIADQATNGIAAVVDGQVQYTPNDDFFGTDSFTYTIEDNDGLTDIATVTVTVENVNDAPVAGDDTVTGILEDSVANTIAVLANDVPGPANEGAAPVNDAVSVLTIADQASNGTAAIVAGQVQYTPNADFFGTDSFTYTIEDNDGLTDTATVNITVDNVNDAPTAVPDTGEAQLLALKDFVNQTLDGVLLNDTDIDNAPEDLEIIGLGATQAQSITTPQGGTLSIADDGKSLVYTPATGFTGLDTFTYTISDGSGGTSSTDAEIDVVDAVPSDISGSVFMDVNGNGIRDPQEIGLSGVEITLTGTNIRGREVHETVKTDGNGVFTFEGVLPNAVDDLIGYSISEKTPEFVTDGSDYIADTYSDEALNPGEAHNDLFTGIRPGLFGSEGRSEMNYHFGERGVTAKYISIAQYLASSNPGLALATGMDGDDYWFTTLKGWEGVQSAHVELSDSLETATLTVTDKDGNTQTQEISYAHYRLAGDRDTGFIIYFNGSPEDLGFDLAAAEGEAEGEAPDGAQPMEMLASRGAREFTENVEKIFAGGDWA